MTKIILLFSLYLPIYSRFFFNSACFGIFPIKSLGMSFTIFSASLFSLISFLLSFHCVYSHIADLVPSIFLCFISIYKIGREIFLCFLLYSKACSLLFSLPVCFFTLSAILSLRVNLITSTRFNLFILYYIWNIRFLIFISFFFYV